MFLSRIFERNMCFLMLYINSCVGVSVVCKILTGVCHFAPHALLLLLLLLLLLKEVGNARLGESD